MGKCDPILSVVLCMSVSHFGSAHARIAGGDGDAKPADDPSSQVVGCAPDGHIVTPVNQVLTPYGKRLDLPGMRPQAVALSPSGKVLVTAGKTSELVVVDPSTFKVIQRISLPPDVNEGSAPAPVSEQILHPDKKGQLSYTGLIFSPAGDRLFMSNVDGSIKIFAVDQAGQVTPERSFALPSANALRRKEEIPSGLAVSPGGDRLYVCGNLSNTLLELNSTTGKVLRSFNVGVAPYDVRLVGKKAYVSNWGGRRPAKGDLTGPAGRGTEVRVDPILNIASEGSVSVVDLEAGETRSEILTELHASGLAVSRDEHWVLCCNAASDTISVIDTEHDAVACKLWCKPNPSELLGAAPNAATFSMDGKALYVANGSQNAVAVFSFDTKEPQESRMQGLVPVGWFPGAIEYDGRQDALIVANIKGLPSEAKEYHESALDAKGYNSHHYNGSLSSFHVPLAAELETLTAQVERNLRAPRISQSKLPPRADAKPRAVPERIGEPSLIKHVVYIVKENRTYDQVFGAIGRGNSDPSLCIFGRKYTPNHHSIVDQFVLLDNAYCCGILSADGHQWTMTASSTDYMEKSFAGFPRSYPDGMGVDENDALAYAPSGFLWDNAIKHGISVRNYGEFMGPNVHWADGKKKDTPNFSACYNAWKEKSNDVVFESWPSLESMRPFSPTDFVGWEMSVPDQWRADYVIRELDQFQTRGEYPQMTVICLPQDHTSGTSKDCPTPAACIADNDLALGRILEAYSRSKFWSDMAVFVIEDDPQAGWDHVSGYRTVALCASPYAKHGALVSTQYNTTSLIRTMEQILGLPPMNAFDASAEPMFDCFTDNPDLTPYTALPSNIALDQMNPIAMDIHDEQLREDALASNGMNFSEPDRAPEAALNRILWRAMRGVLDPYPIWAEAAVSEDDGD